MNIVVFLPADKCAPAPVFFMDQLRPVPARRFVAQDLVIKAARAGTLDVTAVS